MAALLSIILHFVLCFLSIVTNEAQLSFNTSSYFSDGYYYALEGATVALTCTIPRNRGPVGIAAIRPKSVGYEFINLVENGLLQETSSGRYSFESSQRNNTLLIRDLMRTGRSAYICWYKELRWCFQRWYGTVVRFICLMTVRTTVKLDVLKTLNLPIQPSFCELVSGIDGIFFSGEDILLRCPTKKLNITVCKNNEILKVDHDVESDLQNAYLLKVLNVNDMFNGTAMSCSAEIDGVERDYCSLFPNITVFNELTVTISPETVIIKNGDNITLACQSHPFLVETYYEWDFYYNDVSLGNISELETSTGAKILIVENIDFQNATSSSLIVSCRVAVRSKNSSVNATITLYPKMDVTAPSKYASPAVIVVPLSVILLMLGILVFGIIYMKVLKKKNDKGRNISNMKEDNLKTNGTNMVTNLYDRGDITKAELGLTKNDSEVADNVAYVSYGDNR